MLDTACARYGGQDIHKIRGVRRLRYHEKVIFNELSKELMDAEFNPRDLTAIFGGSSQRTSTDD